CNAVAAIQQRRDSKGYGPAVLNRALKRGLGETIALLDGHRASRLAGSVGLLELVAALANRERVGRQSMRVLVKHQLETVGQQALQHQARGIERGFRWDFGQNIKAIRF